MTVIVIDTNIIANCPRLDSPALTSLVEHAEDWGVRVVVPEVVAMESVNVIRRHWKAERDRLFNLPLKLFGLAEGQAAMVAAIDQASEEYEQWLSEQLAAKGIVVQPVPDVDHMEIARRASAGRTPFTRGKDGKTKDGYRDTLIWLTVLALANEHTDDEIWLVSDNHHDFGPTTGDWTGPKSGKRDDCPINFDDHLADELAAQGLSDRVHYVVSAAVLEQHLASQFAPIDAAELEQLAGTISMSAAAGQLMLLTLGKPLDPDAAALPAGAELGEIVGVREQHQGWTFTDAARRGAAGWTARFAVDTEFDIEVAGAPWIGSEQSKVLTVAGRVYVSPTGEIVDMAVDSIEAAPGDQERARRARRHASDAMKDMRRWVSGPSTTSELAAQLGRINSPSTTSELAAQLGRISGPSTTSELAAQLGRISGPGAISDIVAQLGKISGPGATNEIAAKLGRISGPSAISDIVAQLGKISGPSTTSELAAQLGRQGGPSAISDVVAQLGRIGDKTPVTPRNDGHSAHDEHPEAAPETDPPSDTAPANEN
ncbi:PIN domain-containing protein [Mycolicibacterium mageritense]|uniref:PIN domain-containing protein n=1 Tax=Mycolicibacterium mageritense TaxID=53462 RepID=UPI0023F06986|nr:PIN domain-containing protein [Mycolicibacterium mageritense]